MNEPTAERWLPIAGFEGRYEVSDLGRVLGVTRQRIKQPTIDPQGYPYVSLSRGKGDSARIRVHVLVTRAFLGPCPEGMEVLHGDGDPTHSALSNLRYGTSSENKFDTVRHGRHWEASKTHCKYGHEYTPENTYEPPNRPGARQCRTCSGVKDLVPVRRVGERTHHCKHGHEWTEENTYINRYGTPICRSCARVRDKKRRPATISPTQDVLSV
jgi:hypothetical protein